MPGPGMLYASAQTLAKATRAGFMATLGLHVGGDAHVMAAALGLALLFEPVPPLCIMLKLLGAGDLICVLLASRVSRLVTRSSRTTARIKAVAGSILIGLGRAVAIDK